jgi:hypothetical protein
MEAYLDLVKLLVEDLGLREADRRLAMTIPKSEGGWLMPVSINQRYILASHIKQRKDRIYIIVGPDVASWPMLRAPVVDGFYSPLSGEAPEDVPGASYVRSAAGVLRNEELKQNWLAAARRELDRRKSSTHRRFHEPLYYRLAVDPDYRKRVLDEAFPAEHG